jgi:hypothetical protein
MKTHFPAAVFLTVLLTSNAVDAWWPVTLSSYRYGDTTYQVCQAAATDAAGNVILTGNFLGTLNFGGSDLVSPVSLDIFLVKFSSAGTHQWSQRFGVSGHQYAQAVTTDASGNVFVAGYFDGTVNFGGADLVSAGAEDIFVVKFNAAGAHQWSAHFGDAGGQFCYSVATDAAGNVYLPCNFTGTVDLGGGVLTSAGSSDIALARFNAAGTHQWSQRFGDTNAQYGFSAATDPSGNVYLGGWFAGTVNFGGTALTASGGYDVCLAKFNAAGAHQWSKRWGSPDSQYLQCVTTDASSNVYLTGHYFGGINFGLGPNPSAGGDDIYLAKLDAAGTPQWARRFGDASSEQYGYALATDASGDVYLAGHTAGTVNFGGGDLVGGGDYDAYLARFNSAGVHRWSARFGDAWSQAAYAVATDHERNVYLAGYFTGTVDFGTGTMTSAGIEDVFLAEFSAFGEGPLVESIADVGNDQGRVVQVRFARSFHDASGATPPITSYAVFRRDDPAPAAASSARDPAGLSDRELLDAGWTEVGSAWAFTTDSYGIEVPTIGDSTIALGPYYSAFFVRAATVTPGTFFDSPADSGYSLDNLAPGVLGALAYDAGVLSWDESSAKDFDYFTVYGADTDSFAVATLVDYCVLPTMDVTASPYVLYFVTATDFSGNEGPPAVVNTLSGVDGTPKRYVLSVSAHPNPFNPATTIRYTVPSKGRVQVGVYDVRGSRVATLLDRQREPGAFTLTWSGRDDGGRPVASGVYFARVSHDSQAKSYKLLLLK